MNPGHLAFCLSLPALAGCVNLPPDGGFATVEEAARAHLAATAVWQRSPADADAAAARVAELLAAPLTADAAVQVALLNNRGLQAAYQELGVAGADLVQAGRLPNPHFSYLRARHGDELAVESALTFNLLALATVPLATEIEARRFERARLAAAGEMLRLAADTRRAWLEAVAAAEALAYLEQALDAADTAAELSARMARAGNASRLAEAREQLFRAETAARLARARQEIVSARERLARQLGLDEGRFRLPARLPELPAAPEELADGEGRALAGRLDLQAVKLEAEGLAKNLGLTRTTRFINVVEFGPARVTETPEPGKSGYELSFELPLFDWGGAKVAKAEALYMQAVHRAAEAVVNARSEVRAAHAAYRAAFDHARRYRDELLPLRRQIAEENLLRYNGMLIGVFELIADAGQQVAAVAAAIEARRDFWLAETDLRQAQTVGAPPARGLRAEAAAPVRAAGH